MKHDQMESPLNDFSPFYIHFDQHKGIPVFYHYTIYSITQKRSEQNNNDLMAVLYHLYWVVNAIVREKIAKIGPCQIVDYAIPHA